MIETKTYIVKIPFYGFYNSIHSENIDQAVNSDIENLTEDQQNDISTDFNYTNKLLNLYSKLYLKHISKILDIELIFESLQKPKEYNFETDSIFAYISEEDLLKINSNINLKLLTEYIKVNFVNHDGFISHYSNDISNWNTNILEWDHNQLYCLIDLELRNIEFDQNYSMDDAISNGEISNIVYDVYSLETLNILENN
jgi:hypothetical protein